MFGILEPNGWKINAPPFDPTPLSKSTPGYMTRAFPTLFPDGAGDFHQARLRKVDLVEYLTHLLRFRGSSICPASKVSVVCLQHITKKQNKESGKNLRETAMRLTGEDIQAILSENDHCQSTCLLVGSSS